MAQKKFVVGCFDEEKVLFPAVKQVRTAGYKIKDVYTILSKEKVSSYIDFKHFLSIYF